MQDQIDQYTGDDQKSIVVASIEHWSASIDDQEAISRRNHPYVVSHDLETDIAYIECIKCTQL